MRMQHLRRYIGRPYPMKSAPGLLLFTATCATARHDTESEPSGRLLRFSAAVEWQRGVRTNSAAPTMLGGQHTVCQGGAISSRCRRTRGHGPPGRDRWVVPTGGPAHRGLPGEPATILWRFVEPPATGRRTVGPEQDLPGRLTETGG